MKSLYDYIVESTQAQKNFWAEQFVKSFDNTEFSKEAIQKIIGNLELDMLKSLSKYLHNNDMTGYMPYEPNNDEFISSENKNKIASQISEYFFKKVAH